MIDWLFITAAHAATAEGGGDIMGAVSTPWSSSTSSGTCRYPSGRLRRLLHQLRALDGDGNPVRPGLLHAQHEGRQPRSHPHAVGDASLPTSSSPTWSGRTRATPGMAYFPIIFTIFLYVLAMNLLGMIPLPKLGQLHGDEPHHRHLRARHVRVGRRHADRHPQARLQVLQAVRAVGRPVPCFCRSSA